MNKFYIHTEPIHISNIETTIDYDFGYLDAHGDEHYDMYVNTNIRKDYYIPSFELISIDILIEKLNYVKNRGANYVALGFNEDHNEYDFSAYDVHLSTPHEIETYNNSFNDKKVKSKKALEDKIRKLQDQLDSM